MGYWHAPMLHINDLTYRIEGRVLFDKATAGIPAGHKVGFVGRNGSGKTTLLRLIAGELQPDDGSINLPRSTRIGWVTQEAPGGPESLLEVVLAADQERARLLAEAETAHDPGRIADIHERLVDIGAHAAPSRAARILAGLGFDEAAQQRPCSEFSGGWRMRVALAAMLFTEPELLLLDEPTNYLDLEGALWLEEYLADYPHTVLIVSHDRELLNRAVGSILHLAQGKLTLYTGGYDRFEEARREKQRLDLKLKKKQDDERRHIEAFITRFKAKASKATQAQSRVKALARMQPIAEQIVERVAPFLFPNPAKAFASPLVRLEGAAVGYIADRPVLQGLDLRLDADDRVGLLGANGNGKSTFAKLISGRMEAMAGRRYASSKMEVGFFAQHQMDDLPAGKTPYEHMQDLMPDATEAQRRAKLGVLGLQHRQGRHQGGEPVGRREGAPAVRAGDLPRAAPADPGRADQPPRRRRARGAGARAQRLRGRRHPDQPRPPPDGCLRRPAVDRARRHRAHLRRRHGPVPRRVPGRARRRPRCATRQAQGQRCGAADGTGRAPAGGRVARRAGAAAGRTSPRPRPRSSCCPSVSRRSTASWPTAASTGAIPRAPRRWRASAAA